MRSRFSRFIAFWVGSMVIFALVLPLGSIAVAHVDGQHVLQVTPEVATNPTGDAHTLTATLEAPAPAGGEEIDFEVESGPSFRAGCTVTAAGTCTGGTTGDTTNTPTTPDLTCTIPQGQTTCQVVFTSDASGTQQIRAWVDDDKNNASTDFDVTEGRNAGSQDCPGSDCTGSGAEPGDRTEPDDTDVVSKTWFGAVAPTTVLDCSPEVASNPASGDGSTETYTCQLWDSKGTASTTDDTTLASAGTRVDGENLAGANDPDDSSAAGTVDFNDACMTGTNGACTINIVPNEAQAGDALICFWADADSDNVFAPAGDQNDGGGCDEADELTNSGTASATTIGTAERDDRTDVVRKTWVARGVAAEIDCTPESDQNIRGTTHTVTCTVVDAFGNPVAGAAADFDVTGRNAAAQNNSTTNQNGVVSFSYADSNAPLTFEGQADTIRGCIDPDATAGCATVTNTDLYDTLRKYWFSSEPTAGLVVLDMSNAGGGDDCENTDAAAESAATNPVSTTAGHLMCVTVLNAQGTPIPGETVTFTITGAGNFFADRDRDGTRDAGEDDLAGTTFTATTDANGDARASIISTQTGTTQVTATADSRTDTGTKTWTVAATEGRNIDCTPNTATNATGTSHVISCLVTDRFGNPVPGVTISATESGPGRLNTPTSVQTDASGVAEFVTSTVVGESGTQTITGTITAPRANGTGNDACERAAGDPTGTTAGNCADTVTKVWQDAPRTACNDSVDNDDDGLIDFPADPGCESAADNNEVNQAPLVTEGPCAGLREGDVIPGGGSGGQNVIVGTSGDDVLNGTASADIICALGGKDVVEGLAGDDQIFGDGGEDLLSGGDDDDLIFGDDGKDAISGDAGDDALDGGGQNDDIRGNQGNDVLWGRNGQDQLRGGGGNDVVLGGANKDVLAGFTGHDRLRGGGDDDILRGKAGNDDLRGKGGNDILSGGSGADALRGGQGQDLCSGGGGRDGFAGCEVRA